MVNKQKWHLCKIRIIQVFFFRTKVFRNENTQMAENALKIALYGQRQAKPGWVNFI